MIIGLDVGGTTIRGRATDLEGNEVASWWRPTPSSGPDALLAALHEGLRAVAGDTPTQAVGIAIPGVVDAAHGTVAHAVNLGITSPLHLAELVATTHDVPVVVDNDVRAAGLGALAHLRQERPDLSDLLLVNLGTGVSAAVVVGGTVHRGPSGLAGEIGHVPVPGGDEPCVCGLRGCLETRLAGPALRRRWPTGDGRSAEGLFAAASDGDPRADVIAQAVVGDLAWLVHFLANLTGIGDVVIGGGIATAHADLLTRLRGRLAQRAEGSALSAAVLDPARVITAPPDLGVRSAVALARTAIHTPPPAASATGPRPTTFGITEGETR